MQIYCQHCGSGLIKMGPPPRNRLQCQLCGRRWRGNDAMKRARRDRHPTSWTPVEIAITVIGVILMIAAAVIWG